MTLKLRAIADADYRVIISWIPDLAASQLWGGPNMVYPLTPKSLKTIMKPNLVRTFVMIDERLALMGVGQIYFKRPSRYHLARIIVNPAARGKGYGRTLVELLMAKSWSVADKYFTLNVNFGNERAQNLYESLGFVTSPPETGSFSETSHFMKKIVASCNSP